nr:MAG TPA: hypothetical protein [Caudoviricetes sp.]
MDKRIDESVSFNGVYRAYAELAADMDKISSATIRFETPGRGGPYWVVIDFETREWMAWSSQYGLAESWETRIVDKFEKFRDLHDMLHIFTDCYAHERLKAIARMKYGNRSFT